MKAILLVAAIVVFLSVAANFPDYAYAAGVTLLAWVLLANGAVRQ